MNTAKEWLVEGLVMLPFSPVYFEFEYSTDKSRIIWLVETSKSGFEIEGHYYFYEPSRQWWFDGGRIVRFCEMDGEAKWQAGHRYTFPELDVAFREDISGRLDYSMAAVLSGLVIMGARGVSTREIDPPEKLQKARIKRGRAPLFSYHVIDIDETVAERPGGASAADRQSVRLHWRRGHVRTLASGLKVKVSPALVGWAQLGFVAKDYRFRP